MSGADLEERLTRLAPTVAPDPEGLAAARSSLWLDIAREDAGVIEPAFRRRRSATAVRWASSAAAVAALTVGLVLWPSHVDDTSAYATWVEVPAPVTAGDAAEQAQRCADSLSSSAPPGSPSASPGDVTVMVAEWRGDWLYTLFTTGERSAGTLVVHECLEPEGWGSASAIASFRPPGPEKATIEGAMGGDDRRSVWGFVGKDVGRVTITRGDGLVLEASVSSGYYAAWWPRPADAGPNAERFTVTWYLEDGTVGGTQEWGGATS